MGDRDRKGSTARVYVGGLSESVKKEDLETEFEKYGKLNSVWVAFNPPGFAFIEFDDMTDAETACDNLNGTDLLGSKLRVEIARGRSRRGGFRGGRGGGGGGYRGGGFRDGGSGGFRGRPSFDRYGGPPRRDSGGPGGRFGGRDGGGGRRNDSFRGGRPDSYGGRGGGGPRRFDSNPRFRSRSPAGGGPRR